jgi:hypothetical protein
LTLGNGIGAATKTTGAKTEAEEDTTMIVTGMGMATTVTAVAAAAAMVVGRIMTVAKEKEMMKRIEWIFFVTL